MILMATGHREPYPNFTEHDAPIISLKHHLKKELCRLKDKIKFAISGAAQGWDTWFAEECLAQGIPFRLYEPYLKHGSGWRPEAKNRHKRLQEAANSIYWVNDEYHKYCFLDRDRAMVDNSTHVMALLNPNAEKGGTLYTVNYAKKSNLPVYNMWRYLDAH